MTRATTELVREGYKITIFHGVNSIDPVDENVDVEVMLADGSRWGATFFTLQNIERLLDRYAESGESSSNWFWSVNMILIRHLTVDSIATAVEELMQESSDFNSAFGLLLDDG